MSGPLDFAAWRLTFQSDAQAARAAFDALCKAKAELARAQGQLLQITDAPRIPLGTITRSPGVCVWCKAPLGQGHTDDCHGAAFVVRRRA